MGISEKLVSNIIYLFLDWFFVFIFSFLFWIIIWKNLSPLDSGIYSTAQNLIILISSFTVVGFSTACSKLIPEYIELKKIELANSLVRFSSTIVFIASIIAAILILFSGPFLTSVLSNFPSDSIIFVALGVIFLSFENIFGYILIGFQDMKKFFLTDILGSVFKFGIALILIFMGFHYIGPLAGLIVSFLIIFILRLNTKWYVKTKMQINRKFVLYDYSLPALASSFGPIIFSNMPYIILAIFSGLVATGIFTAAISVTSQLGVLISILSTAIFPVVSQLSVYRNSKNKQNAIINLGVKYGLLVTLPIALVLVLAPRAIILLLSQPNYLPAVNLFSILSLSFIIMGLGNIFLSSLYAVRKPKTNRNIWIFTAFIFIALSVPLTIYYSAFGISIAYLASVSILLFLSVFYLRKYLKFKLNWMEILKILIASFVLVIFILFADQFAFPNFVKYLIGFLGFVFYFVSLLFMKFFTKSDVTILEILAAKIPFLKNLFQILSKIISEYS